MSKRLTPEQKAERASMQDAERQAHIDKLVAAAPVPSSVELDMLARLLLPSLLKRAETRLAEDPQAALRELHETRHLRRSAGKQMEGFAPFRDEMVLQTDAEGA